MPLNKTYFFAQKIALPQKPALLGANNAHGRRFLKDKMFLVEHFLSVID
jgi:hypothetical protein